MSEQPAGAARTPDNSPQPDEARTVSPFVRMDRGFASIDPSDPNNVVFEDFSPRVLDADAPDEVYVEPEISTIPKGSSAPVPASSSESPPPTEPPKLETPVPAESTPTQEPVTEPAVGTVSTPPMPTLGPLPFPTSPSTEGAETGDGSPSPTEAG